MWSLAVGRHRSGKRQRDSHEYRRPFPGGRFHLDLAIHQRRALLHAEQAEVLAVRIPRNGVWLEAFPIVLDYYGHLIGTSVDDNTHATRVRVFQNICERLLHDPIDGGLDCWRKPFAGP